MLYIPTLKMEIVRLLFQLQLSRSPLRSRKDRYVFSVTPSDIGLCKHGAEDTRHFFFLSFLCY